MCRLWELGEPDVEADVFIHGEEAVLLHLLQRRGVLLALRAEVYELVPQDTIPFDALPHPRRLLGEHDAK